MGGGERRQFQLRLLRPAVAVDGVDPAYVRVNRHCDVQASSLDELKMELLATLREAEWMPADTNELRVLVRNDFPTDSQDEWVLHSGLTMPITDSCCSQAIYASSLRRVLTTRFG